MVLWHRPGQTSALDEPLIAGGADIGTVGVFAPEVDGRRLHFRGRNGQFEDVQTGSRWNVLGRAVSGPLKGEQLATLQHLDTFWFARVTFHPDTELVEPTPSDSR